MPNGVADAPIASRTAMAMEGPKCCPAARRRAMRTTQPGAPMNTSLEVVLAAALFVAVSAAIALAMMLHMSRTGLRDAAARCRDLAGRLFDVEAREARFRQALGFYGDADHWMGGGNRKHSPAFKDRGRAARDVLGKTFH